MPSTSDRHLPEQTTLPQSSSLPVTPVPARPARWLRPGEDAGMATAEYAVATLAACGFAGLLVAVLSGGEVRGMLLSIVKRALTLD